MFSLGGNPTRDLPFERQMLAKATHSLSGTPDQICLIVCVLIRHHVTDGPFQAYLIVIGWPKSSELDHFSFQI
jgi:hypothetical protein